MNAKKKEIEIKEIQVPAKSLLPSVANLTAIYSHEDMLIIDFGFLAPPYIEESDYLEDTQIARICMPWPAAEELSSKLAETVQTHFKKKTKKKGKSEGIK